MKLSEKLKALNMKILAGEKYDLTFWPASPYACNSESQIELINHGQNCELFPEYSSSANIHFVPVQNLLLKERWLALVF